GAEARDRKEGKRRTKRRTNYHQDQRSYPAKRIRADIYVRTLHFTNTLLQINDTYKQTKQINNNTHRHQAIASGIAGDQLELRSEMTFEHHASETRASFRSDRG